MPREAGGANNGGANGGGAQYLALTRTTVGEVSDAIVSRLEFCTTALDISFSAQRLEL